MKKLIGIIVVLIVIVFIFTRFGGNNVNTVINPGDTTVTTVVTAAGEPVPDGVYVANSDESTVNWSGKKILLENYTDTGVIDLANGQITIENGQIASGSFVIDMTSIAASTTGRGDGQTMLTGHLKSADFFDVEKFATSTFVAREFRAATNTNVIVGDLTIKGITNEVAIPVTFAYESDGTLIANGSVDIDRTLWDVRFGSEKFFKGLGDNVIGDMFNLSFSVEMERSTSTPTTTATSTSATTTLSR